MLKIKTSSDFEIPRCLQWKNLQEMFMDLLCVMVWACLALQSSTAKECCHCHLRLY